MTPESKALLAEYRAWFDAQGWEAEGWDADGSEASLAQDLAAIEEAAVAPFREALFRDADGRVWDPDRECVKGKTWCAAHGQDWWECDRNRALLAARPASEVGGLPFLIEAYCDEGD